MAPRPDQPSTSTNRVPRQELLRRRLYDLETEFLHKRIALHNEEVRARSLIQKEYGELELPEVVSAW